MMLAKYFFKPTIISRADWNAEKPRKKGTEVNGEVENLIMTFTGTDPCDTKEVCVKRVQDIQKREMEESSSDIRYNFLIGGDGNVYEGRGWKVAPDLSTDNRQVQQLKGNSVQIAFISAYGDKPSTTMLKAFAGLLIKGTEEDVITKDIKKINPCVVVGKKLVSLKALLSDQQKIKMQDDKSLEKYKKMLMEK